MNSTRQIAQLPTRLKGFVEPDTSSQFEGYLDPGKYTLLEYRQNFPDQDTDFALVQAPTLGAGDTWLCTRWRNQRYADVIEEETQEVERQGFDDDSMAIPESALLDLLPEFEDFTYDLDEARYPYDLPGVNLPQAPPRSNNCCTFAEALLVRAWADAANGFEWDHQRHGQMMIYSNDDLFSPATVAVEAGMAAAVADPDTPPHPWTLIQGWRHQWRSGHTFLIVDHHPPTDRVLTLESNSSYKLDGVGFRALGNLRDFGGQPPEAWWEQENLWTWERICSTYRYRHQAWMKVKDRSWSGL